MNAKSIAMGVVAMVVATVLVVTCAVPIITDSVATEDTFTNEGYFYLDKFTDEYTFYWDRADPTTFTINGEDFTYLNDSGLAVSVVLGEKFAVRMGNGNPDISFYGNGSYVSTNAEKPTFTLTLSSGTLTATNGTDTKQITSVSEIFSIVEKGDYVMKKSTSVAYLNSGSEIVADSEIYASGQTYNGANNIWWHLEGTIDNMEYPDTFNNTLTITNESINGHYDNSHDDLYALNNLTFTATASNSVVYNVTASYFVVPAEVTAERTYHVDGPTGDILAVIPILMVLGIVIGAVALFLTNRRD